MTETIKKRIPQVDRRNHSVAAILKAAEQEFAEMGYKGATLRGIAERAQLPKTNVQYYFHNKLNLYQQVLQNVLNCWMDATQEFEGDEPPEVVIRRYIEAKMDLARQHPNGSKVWANEIINGAPIIQPHLEGSLKPWVDAHCARFQQWIEAGLIKPIEPLYFLYMIWASTQHYADFAAQMHCLNQQQRLSDEQFLKAKQTVVEVLLSGILQPPSNANPE